MNTLESGTQFGKYRIEKMIGQGGMGVVYVAEDTTLGRRVALKVLSPDLVSRRAFEERFRREARIIARLNHPNIVQIHSLETIDEKLVIDMTYVEGGSLADAEGARRVTIGHTLQSVADALTGLASCHQIGVIHRDVKPSNILLSHHGMALLSDFGLSKCLAVQHESAMSSMASSCLFLGTPRYAPPESWEGKAPTPAWDIYSIGAVIYESIAGRAPHEANSPLELIRSFYENPVPPLSRVDSDISGVLSETVEAMLACNPRERPPDAAAALERLTKAPEFKNKDSRKGSTIVQLKWRPKKISRRPSILKKAVLPAVFALLVLLGIGAILLPLNNWFSGASPQPRAASNHYVFNARDTLTNEYWPEHWLMTRTDEHDVWHVLASKGTDILYLYAPADEDAFDFQGFWAHYTDKTARAFRHGTLHGIGTWIRPNELMTVTLQFECQLDGARWQNAFLLERTMSDKPPEQFVAELESAALIPRLIYSELVPRNLDWAEELENRFLVPGVSKATVPFVTASGGPMQIDGQGAETVWQGAATNGTPDFGVLPSRPDGNSATLTVCRDESRLYFLCTSPRALKTPILTLRFLTGFDIYAQQAVWKLEVEQSGATRLYKVVGEREYPQDAEIMAARLSEGEHYEVEIAVPFAALEVAQPPLQGDRWRLSATLADAQKETDLAAYWGRTPGVSPVHGAILQFGPAM